MARACRHVVLPCPGCCLPPRLICRPVVSLLPALPCLACRRAHSATAGSGCEEASRTRGLPRRHDSPAAPAPRWAGAAAAGGAQHPAAHVLARSPSNNSDWDSTGYVPLSPTDGAATLLAAAAEVEEQALLGSGSPLPSSSVPAAGGPHLAAAAATAATGVAPAGPAGPAAPARTWEELLSHQLAEAQKQILLLRVLASLAAASAPTSSAPSSAPSPAPAP